MTRKSFLLCTAMAFAAGSPQFALSEPLSDAAQYGIHVAQANERDKDKHQHEGNGPNAHPGPGNTHTGTPVTPPPGQTGHTGNNPQTPPTGQNGQGMHTNTNTQTPPTGQGGQGMHTNTNTQTSPTGQGGQGMHTNTNPQTPPTGQGGQGMHTNTNTQTPPTGQNGQGLHTGTNTQTPPPGTQQRPPVATNMPIDPKTQPRRLDQVRADRKEVHDGNRTVITESNRTIIQENGHQIIRHDPTDRFRINAKEVNVEHRGTTTITAVLQPGGFRIVTEVDDTGRLLRRIRRDAAGRDVILIDNSFETRGPGMTGIILDLRPPVVTIAPQLYIREAAAATAADIFLTLTAPPVVRIERRYALDEILYNEPLRARMPRVDIDTVNFDTGSWDIAPDQADRLAFVAQGILNAVQRNPAEMFLIEGYTDAVGNDVDNLSLSDHRAESVAEMLTSQFNVPAENLTTQGYGKQFLKVPTDGPERANRRVAVRRITPLLTGQN